MSWHDVLVRSALAAAVGVVGCPTGAAAQQAAPSGMPPAAASSSVSASSAYAPAAIAPARLGGTNAAVGEPAERREPDVRHHVIEDGGSKIDELVVRGQLQHVVVTPKVGTGIAYEIIVPRGGRTPPDSTGGAMSAVGKRVWNVLAF